MKQRTTEELGKMVQYCRARAMRSLGEILLNAPDDLAAIRSGCLADYLLHLLEAAKRSIAKLDSTPVSGDVNEDLTEAAMRVQPIWILFDTLRKAVRVEQDSNCHRLRPITATAGTVFCFSDEQGHRVSFGRFVEHELEVLDDFRHWGAHFGGAPGARSGTAAHLSDLRLLHRKTDSKSPFKVATCPDCDGWWRVGGLLAIAKLRMGRIEPALRQTLNVFTSDIWKKYAASWDKIVAMEPFLGGRPSIFQLNEILAAARKSKEPGTG